MVVNEQPSHANSLILYHLMDVKTASQKTFLGLIHAMDCGRKEIFNHRRKEWWLLSNYHIAEKYAKIKVSLLQFSIHKKT